jgi:hypothetical protein
MQKWEIARNYVLQNSGKDLQNSVQDGLTVRNGMD